MHTDVNKCSAQVQAYITQKKNKVATTKFPSTLLTSHNKDQQTLMATLNSTIIPHAYTQILSVTYNTSMSIAPHINIITKCRSKLNPSEH